MIDPDECLNRMDKAKEHDKQIKAMSYDSVKDIIQSLRRIKVLNDVVTRLADLDGELLLDFLSSKLSNEEARELFVSDTMNDACKDVVVSIRNVITADIAAIISRLESMYGFVYDGSVDVDTFLKDITSDKKKKEKKNSSDEPKSINDFMNDFPWAEEYTKQKNTTPWKLPDRPPYKWERDMIYSNPSYTTTNNTGPAVELPNKINEDDVPF